MRKMILAGLVAGMMVPGAAIAAPHGDYHHGRTHQARQHDTRQYDRYQARQHENRQYANRQYANRQYANRQYDRQQNRHHNRNWAAYSAPVRNWQYRPVTIGFQLQPSFYGSRYYVNDYSGYQLRAPGRFQRWVRYGDDLLLVNVRTGRVIEVLHNRYW